MGVLDCVLSEDLQICGRIVLAAEEDIVQGLHCDVCRDQIVTAVLRSGGPDAKAVAKADYSFALLALWACLVP